MSRHKGFPFRTLTLAVAMGMATTTSQAVVVLVDFASVTPDPAGNWNVIASNTGTTNNLIDTDGIGSGISLTLNGWSSSGQNDAFQGRNESPGWTDGNVENDRHFMGNNSTGSLVLTGLDPSLTYRIELVSSSTSMTGAGNINLAGDPPGYLRIQDPDGVVDAFNAFDGSLLTGNNPGASISDPETWAAWSTAYYGNDFPDSSTSEFGVEGWILWDGLIPDALNSITIEFQTLGGNSRASINAMRIEGIAEPLDVIPEPGSAVLLGLSSLLVVLARRRRRR